MKTINDVKKEQASFHRLETKFIKQYINTNLIGKKNIQSILLSGSLARKDYWPGQFGGAIDLTLILKNKKKFDCDRELGKAEESIPDHFIKIEDRYIQFKLYDIKEIIKWTSTLTEAGKYAILESKIIVDKKDVYNRTMKDNRQIIRSELRTSYINTKSHINRLVNGYIVDRWLQRNVISQLNFNLDMAIITYIKCLFYKNQRYCPADNRMLYFSYHLPKLPENYIGKINEVMEVKNNTKNSYLKREKIFKGKLLSFLK